MPAGAPRLVPFLLASVAIHGVVLLAGPERLTLGTAPAGTAHSISIELVPAGRPAARATAAGDAGAEAESDARQAEAEPGASDDRPEPGREVARADPETPTAPGPDAQPPPEPVSREERAPEARAAPAEPADTTEREPPPRERVAEASPRPPAQARPGPDEAGPARDGAGAGGDAARAAEAERVRAHIASRLAEHFRYPPLARQRGWEGRVVLAFRVQADGRLSDIRVAESSGRAILDEAALRALRRVGRVPALAERAGVEPLALELPVTYRLHSA